MASANTPSEGAKIKLVRKIEQVQTSIVIDSAVMASTSNAYQRVHDCQIPSTVLLKLRAQIQEQSASKQRKDGSDDLRKTVVELRTAIRALKSFLMLAESTSSAGCSKSKDSECGNASQQ